MLFFFNSLDGQKLLGEFRLTRIALNTQAEIPSATSYSPRSFGRIKLFSIEEVNILPSMVLGWARNRSWSTINRVSSTTRVSLSPSLGLLLPTTSLAIPAARLSRGSKLNLDFTRPSWSPPQGNKERAWKPHRTGLLSLSDIMLMSPSSLLLAVSRLWVLDLFTRQGFDLGVPRQLVLLIHVFFLSSVSE